MRTYLSVNPPKENPEYIIRQSVTPTRGKSGSFTTLTFSPRMYLKLAPIGLEVHTRIAIPIGSIQLFAAQLRHVYQDIQYSESIYTHDENNVLIIDHGAAKKMAKGISLYTEKLYIMPAVVADTMKSVKGILFISTNGESGSVTLSEAKAFIERLETLDPTSISLLMVLLEEQSNMKHQLDRMERKLDDVLKAVRGTSFNAKSDTGLGPKKEWKGDQIIWKN